MRGNSGFSGEETKLKQETINGRKFDIYVSTDGKFYTYMDKERDQKITSKNLTDIPGLVRAAMRKTGLKIPVTVIRETRHWERDVKTAAECYKFEDGYLTGLHSTRRRAALVQSPEGRSISLDYDDDLVRRLTPEERLKFLELVDAVAVSTKTLTAFKDDIKVNPERLIEAAVAEKDPVSGAE